MAMKVEERKALVIEFLAVAKEHVTRGWLQGASEDPVTGNVCAGRALHKACGDYPGGMVTFSNDLDMHFAIKKAHQFFMQAMNDLFEGPGDPCASQWENIPDWNDHKGRTQEEVIHT